ncbi:MAG: hypothetical protein AB7G37_20140 [Solirubrobacteraceae bacterium]
MSGAAVLEALVAPVRRRSAALGYPLDGVPALELVNRLMYVPEAAQEDVEAVCRFLRYGTTHPAPESIRSDGAP